VSSIIYGPVPSWRLGRSLGIDLLPGRGKTCCFDCIYCQLGKTSRPQTERSEFVALDRLARELERVRDVPADYATFSGTGEPTLGSNLGQAIDLVKTTLGLPVAVLTNSALLPREDVQQELSKADVVVAKLDAPDERLFRRINKSMLDGSLEEIIEAIGRFRSQYDGRLALQMMFVAANRSAASQMARIAAQLSPDEVQINTPLRPSPVAPLAENELAAVRDEFRGLEAVFSVYESTPPEVMPLDVQETLRRRPTSKQSSGGRARG
jgi:wyosine [tRNA(Phe)-imidazoG37] synthetase (radical SAM superfamily)